MCIRDRISSVFRCSNAAARVSVSIAIAPIMPIFFFSAILYNQLPFSRVPRVSEKRGSFLLELLSRLLRNKLQEVFIFAQFEAELIYHIRIVRTVIEIDIMAVLAHIRDLEIGCLLYPSRCV